MEQLSSYWIISVKYLKTFQKSAEKILGSLKADTHEGTLHEDVCTFMIDYR